MFLGRVPNDSKIIITFITGALFGGVGVGIRKLMYDPNIIVKKSHSVNVNNKVKLLDWEEIICNVM